MKTPDKSTILKFNEPIQTKEEKKIKLVISLQFEDSFCAQ